MRSIAKTNADDLCQLAVKRQNFKQALRYKLMSDSLNQILFNNEKQQLTAQAKARYAFQQRQSEIERLRWESQLQEMDNEEFF